MIPMPIIKNFWSSPTLVGSCYTDADPTLTGDGSRLYLGFKKKDSNQLYVARYEKSGRDWIWTDPVDTLQTSDHGPALAVFNGQLYMAWLSTDGSKRFSFGRVQENGKCTFDGFVPDAISEQGPTLATWNGGLWIGYCHDDTSEMRTASFKISWSKSSEVQDQLSQDPPVFCTAANQLYLFHRGKSGEDIWYSARSTSDSNWPENETIDEAISQDRAGVGLFGTDFLVLCHNGKKDSHIWWQYLDLSAGVWHHMGLCGGEIDIGPITVEPRQLETDNAPALWFLADSGKLMMVYSNTTDTSDQIVYSFLSEIA